MPFRRQISEFVFCTVCQTGSLCVELCERESDMGHRELREYRQRVEVITGNTLKRLRSLFAELDGDEDELGTVVRSFVEHFNAFRIASNKVIDEMHALGRDASDTNVQKLLDNESRLELNSKRESLVLGLQDLEKSLLAGRAHG